MTLAAKVRENALPALLHARHADLATMCDGIDVKRLPDFRWHRILQKILCVLEPHPTFDQPQVHEQPHAVSVDGENCSIECVHHHAPRRLEAYAW